MTGIGLIEGVGLELGHVDLDAEIGGAADGAGLVDWLGPGGELPILPSSATWKPTTSRWRSPRPPNRRLTQEQTLAARRAEKATAIATGEAEQTRLAEIARITAMQAQTEAEKVVKTATIARDGGSRRHHRRRLGRKEAAEARASAMRTEATAGAMPGQRSVKATSPMQPSPRRCATASAGR